MTIYDASPASADAFILGAGPCGASCTTAFSGWTSTRAKRSRAFPKAIAQFTARRSFDDTGGAVVPHDDGRLLVVGQQELIDRRTHAGPTDRAGRHEEPHQ